MFIHICCEQKELIEDCKTFIQESFIFVPIFSESYTNQFEYPGLMLLYELSKNSSDIFFYFHSKGMVFNNPSNERNEFEKKTLRSTLFFWKFATTIFKKIVNVHKVGLWPSQEGYIWVNFFYIRGGYLKVPPIITEDRWWYETYINQSGNYFDCYSLTKNKICGIHPDTIKDDHVLVDHIDSYFSRGYLS
jgi:hypothetical protein